MGSPLSSLRDLGRRLLGRPSHGTPATPVLQPVKTELIDLAFGTYGLESFADLGGVWAVEAGYTFHALEHHNVKRAFLVDTGITPAVREKAMRFPHLQLVNANFGDASTVEAIRPVDAVFLFDVLLHQVDPDWDEILRMYAPATRAFLIVNPAYTKGSETIRLLDLGPQGYLDVVPAVPVHEEALGQLDAIHPKYGRPYRDIHEIWQWGIVDSDLDATLAELGFKCVHRQNTGPWLGLPSFDNHAMLYLRDAT